MPRCESCGRVLGLCACPPGPNEVGEGPVRRGYDGVARTARGNARRASATTPPPPPRPRPLHPAEAHVGLEFRPPTPRTSPPSTTTTVAARSSARGRRRQPPPSPAVAIPRIPSASDATTGDPTVAWRFARGAREARPCTTPPPRAPPTRFVADFDWANTPTSRIFFDTRPLTSPPPTAARTPSTRSSPPAQTRTRPTSPDERHFTTPVWPTAAASSDQKHTPSFPKIPKIIRTNVPNVPVVMDASKVRPRTRRACLRGRRRRRRRNRGDRERR